MSYEETQSIVETFSCSNCKFSAPHGSGYLECRRFPPKVMERDSDFSEFPVVTHDVYCGEHLLKTVDVQKNSC